MDIVSSKNAIHRLVELSKIKIDYKSATSWRLIGKEEDHPRFKKFAVESLKLTDKEASAIANSSVSITKNFPNAVRVP